MWFKLEKENYLPNLEFISFEENTQKINIVNEKLTSFLGKKINLDENINTNIFEKKNYEINENLKKLILDYSKSFEDIDFKRIGL